MDVLDLTAAKNKVTNDEMNDKKEGSKVEVKKAILIVLEMDLSYIKRKKVKQK